MKKVLKIFPNFNNTISGPIQKLFVHFESEKVKNLHSPREGAYILQSSLVNDRPYWLKEDSMFGIWFDPKDAKWKIGTKNVIGSSLCAVQSNANALWPNEATNWAYDNYTWMTIPEGRT